MQAAKTQTLLILIWLIFSLVAGGLEHASVTATGHRTATVPQAVAATRALEQPLNCASMPAGLRAWFRGEGNANDAGGTLNGTLQNGASFAAGKVGLAFSFDGVDDTVETSATTVLNGPEATIEAWVKPEFKNDGAPDAFYPNNVISNDRSGLAGRGFGVNVYSGGSALTVEYNDGFRVVPNVAFTAGEWYHVSVVYTAGNYKAYLNGQLVDDFNFTQQTPKGVELIYLGKHNDDEPSYGTRRFFKGLIDEAAVFDRALTPAEIQAVFTAGSAGKCLMPNTPPTITVAALPTRQQGSPPMSVRLATVSDAQTPAGELTIQAASVPTGITLTSLDNTNGAVTALLATSCNAPLGPHTIVLTVSDGELTSMANLTVNVTANTPPTLGTYATTNLNLGSSIVVTPDAAPSDNGTLVSLTASAPNLNAFLDVSPITGAVTIANTANAGSFTVTITATDNCGVSSTRSFALKVNKASTTLALTASATQLGFGQAITFTAVVRTPMNLAVTPGGTVTFKDGSVTLGTAALNNAGQAVLTTTALVLGAHSLTASYGGDANFEAANATALTVTVNASLTVVSAASYNPTLTPEMIVAGFGRNLSTGQQAAASLPLPTTLAGASVRVKDSAGVERLAPLFFVSPAQLNFMLPSGTSSGTALITVTNSTGASVTGLAEIAAPGEATQTLAAGGPGAVETVAPGLFTADASGRGLAAAQVLRVLPNGTQRYEPVVRYDPSANRFVAVPIEFGPSAEQLFLLLYGTGFRLRSQLGNVTATVGGVSVPVLYAGAQGSLAGLDQANLQLSPALAGRGEVAVVFTLDGKPSNTVLIQLR